MVKVTINGREYEFENDLTIIQACEEVGIQIPRFCYHEKLAIAGNCRMCLVEVEKSPKPVASCSIAITNGMMIHTESDLVKKAREGVMEFLLINHPLDCPICDQGGECDLQDQAFKYGKCKSNYKEEKRAVSDKYIGPLIATHMTRCIHCTRCVRFLEDIAGTSELGAIGRGENMEISTYIEKSITSELSGNIIDLCPVGALTSKPYAYTARSWELRHTYSIDVMDGVGSHIRIDTRDNQVMRILPNPCEDINEEWISDKTRFAYDGLKYQRLNKALIRENDVLRPIENSIAIERVANLLKNSESTAMIVGKLTDVETIFAAKELLKHLKNGYADYEVPIHGLISKNPGDYIFNSTIAGIEQADVCLLIHTNPRHEAAVLNARIRKCVVHNNLKVAFIGKKVNLNYNTENLGENVIEILTKILNDKHEYCKILETAKNPMMILGSSLFESTKSKAIHDLCKQIAAKYKFITHEWNGFNVLHFSAGAVGALQSGFVNHSVKGKKVRKLSEFETIILFGADDINLSNVKENANIIYIGHNGDKSVYKAHVILPSPAFVEKSGTYINTEGRVQRTMQAVKSLENAIPEYDIILSIAKAMKLELNFSDLNSLREYMSKYHKVFAKENLFKINRYEIAMNEFEEFKKVKLTFQYPIDNFYLTDSISRSSKVMAECLKMV